jgi:hypothetical protein
MRNKNRDTRWLAAFAAVAMGCLGFGSGASAAAGIAGTYTGIFQGGDNGTVTIVVKDDNTVTCDFYSSISATHYASAGTVHTTSPFVLDCTTPDGSPFLWTADSNNSSSVGISVSGLWGSDFGATNNSGTFTAYYSSTNSDPAGSIVYSSYSGLWYDPSFTGSGFNFINAGVGFLVTYYGWDAAGQRMWLTSEIGPPTVTNGTAITLKMSYTTGGTFNNPQNNHADWGTLTLIFSSCHAATATLSGPDGTQNLKLSQLASVVANPGC